jgi:nucleoside-diphosphate-sugar epimerase
MGNQKQRILVTGGAGYLGSIMVPEMLKQGFDVTVLDNFMYRQNSLGHVCDQTNFNIIRGDARDLNAMKALVKNADIIVPLAALVGAPLCDENKVGAETLNRDAQLSLFKMMSREQRLLIPITNSGYGVGEPGKYCTEETPMRPLSLYGIHKVEIEKEALCRENTISFRLATVFGMGPRMRLDLLVNDFVYRALKDRALVLFESHFKRNYIHVRDVARAFLHGIENFDAMKSEPYNVGLSDANLSKWELCEKIQSHLPNFTFLESEIGEDPDKRDYIVSNDKIENTGFMPKYSLDDGIKELLKGYQMIRNSVYGNV